MSSRLFFGVMLSVSSLFSLAQGLPAFRPRKALIIANADYQQQKIPNTMNDGREMAKLLRNFRFDVTYEKNLDQSRMKDVISGFIDNLKRGDVAFIYFAGHAMEQEKVNYLMPVDCSFSNGVPNARDGISLDSIESRLDITLDIVSDVLVFVILDACRNQPRGFVVEPAYPVDYDPRVGMAFFFATKPGGYAFEDTQEKHGRFTLHLLHHMRKHAHLPFTKIAEKVTSAVIKASDKAQKPWFRGQLSGDAFILGSPGIPSQIYCFDGVPGYGIDLPDAHRKVVENLDKYHPQQYLSVVETGLANSFVAPTFALDLCPNLKQTFGQIQISFNAWIKLTKDTTTSGKLKETILLKQHAASFHNMLCDLQDNLKKQRESLSEKHSDRGLLQSLIQMVNDAIRNNEKILIDGEDPLVSTRIIRP